MNNQRLYIIYDVTRLLTRFRAPTPSGIDRIDLTYIKFFLNTNNYSVLSIYQYRETIYIIPEKIMRKFIKYLTYRWLDKEFLTNHQSKILLSYLLTYEVTLNTIFNFKKAKKKKITQWLIKHQEDSVCYFNVSHHGFKNTILFQLLKQFPNVKLFFCLSDLIPIEHPEFYPDNTNIKHIEKVKLIIEYADVVLVISSYTEDRLHQFCKQHMLNCPKTQVIHIGVENAFINYRKHATSNITHKYKINNKDYFITIGTIEPRKNHLLLLNLWRKMTVNSADHCPILLIIGKRGWCNQHITNMLDKCESIQDTVIELSDLGDDEIVALLKGARALLAPSFVEGWGIPVAEALTVGTPVIASDIDAFKESGQELIEYLNPIDTITWEHYIHQYSISNPEDYRTSALKCLNAYSPPTWEKHFDQLENIINNTLCL